MKHWRVADPLRHAKRLRTMAWFALGFSGFLIVPLLLKTEELGVMDWANLLCAAIAPITAVGLFRIADNVHGLDAASNTADKRE